MPQVSRSTIGGGRSDVSVDPFTEICATDSIIIDLHLNEVFFVKFVMLLLFNPLFCILKMADSVKCWKTGVAAPVVTRGIYVTSVSFSILLSFANRNLASGRFPT